MATYEPSIRNILEAKDLRWIFVGGKGGVGKTTCSCSLAIQLAQVRDNVLILSTDPAHNLSDAFGQKFSKVPTKVTGFDNLFAMEIDPNFDLDSYDEDLVSSGSNELASFRKTISKFMTSLPGIDEYMSYTEVFKLVNNLDYSVVVFDTAPTGHTLRLLAFPDRIDQSLTQLISVKNQFSPFLNQFTSLLGMSSDSDVELTRAIETHLPVIKEITRQFKDSSRTTFVCVCIPEFLSLYETERLIQELDRHQIDVHNVIVNQLLFPNLSTEKNARLTGCKMCLARHKIQTTYLKQALELYDYMHVIQLPLLEEEVRKTEKIKEFSKYLLEPFTRTIVD